jgi:predicted nucleic acid-binding Zn ribbon protein
MNCKRCGKPILEARRRSYCSEACADVVAHAKRLERLAQGKPRLMKFRIYEKGQA